jgi:hypothetical protein
LGEVLSRFADAGLKLNEKYVFGTNEVEYLGYKFSEQGMTAVPHKLEAIARMTPPDTAKKLYSLLCGMQYYRRMIPRFGEVSEPLYALAANKKQFKWNPETIKKFETLKLALLSAPIMAYPEPNKPYIMHKDASGSGLASVLYEQQDGILKPIMFSSQKLNKHEKNYSATEREMAAIVQGMDTFRPYIYGRHTDVYTDHKPLVTAKNLKRPMGRLGRMFICVQDFDYTLHTEKKMCKFLNNFV